MVTGSMGSPGRWISGSLGRWVTKCDPIPSLIQTAGLAFGGTGLCSYRVRGVDGSCVKHLTVESYTVIYAANSHIIIIIIISVPLPLSPSFQA